MKIDLHVHTSEISACGMLSAEDTVRLYAEAGYDAIVITNHFAAYNKERFERAGLDFFSEYMKGYELARSAGERYGITVLCGFELRFNRNENDYLVYGMDEQTASDCSSIFAMGPREFSALAREKDFLFYQAHPFRNNMTVVYPGYLFGIEIKNGNPRHDSRNDIAAMWAEKYGLHGIAGSDCHQTEDVGASGIITGAAVRNTNDLVAVLKSSDYTII